jgi:hypothetical protein
MSMAKRAAAFLREAVGVSVKQAAADSRDYRSKWPRLRFTDGGKVDLDRLVPYWEQDAFAAEWRAIGVKVEWLLTPKGRLDAALKLAKVM